MVEVLDPAQGPVARHAAVWRDGAWTIALSLPTGSYKIVAETGDGLTGSTALTVTEPGADPHALRVPLRAR